MENEKRALGVFNEILKDGNPTLDSISNNALVYGVPNEWRAITWQICLGYLPSAKDQRSASLLSQREAYLKIAKNICRLMEVLTMILMCNILYT
jgi:agmatine/peptidylarginine deiminase